MTPNAITLYLLEDPTTGDLELEEDAGYEDYNHSEPPLANGCRVVSVGSTLALTHDVLDKAQEAITRYRASRLGPRPQPGPLDDLGETR